MQGEGKDPEGDDTTIISLGYLTLTLLTVVSLYLQIRQLTFLR